MRARIQPGMVPVSVAELAETYLPLVDGTHAVAASSVIEEPWCFRTADHLATEQEHAWMAEGEVASRAAQVDAAGSKVSSTATSRLVAVEVAGAENARIEAITTRSLLGPWARRKPHAGAWYIAWMTVLYTGDISGITGAAWLLGELPVLGVLLAVAVGMAAVISGSAGTDVKRVRMARERAAALPQVPVELERWRGLFTGTEAGWPLSKAMIKVSAAITICVAVGILGLRAALDGPGIGVTFAAFSVAITLGSFVNSYVYADEVSEVIDAAEHAATRLTHRAERHATSPVVRRHERAAETARSVEAEYAARGLAAREHITATQYLAASRNPQVLGHGPAAITENGGTR